MAQQYRKKPVVIEAMEWDGTATGATSVIGWALSNDVIIGYRCENGQSCKDPVDSHRLRIPTLEGVMFAAKGDYIIKGVNGEFYPCKPDIFAKTYEPA